MEQKYKDALVEIINCFDVAIIEGLYNVLQNTTDARLKNLIERRIMYAYHTALNVVLDNLDT